MTTREKNMLIENVGMTYLDTMEEKNSAYMVCMPAKEIEVGEYKVTLYMFTNSKRYRGVYKINGKAEVRVFRNGEEFCRTNVNSATDIMQFLKEVIPADDAEPVAEVEAEPVIEAVAEVAMPMSEDKMEDHVDISKVKWSDCGGMNCDIYQVSVRVFTDASHGVWTTCNFYMNGPSGNGNKEVKIIAEKMLKEVWSEVQVPYLNEDEPEVFDDVTDAFYDVFREKVSNYNNPKPVEEEEEEVEEVSMEERVIALEQLVAKLEARIAELEGTQTPIEDNSTLANTEEPEPVVEDNNTLTNVEEEEEEVVEDKKPSYWDERYNEMLERKEVVSNKVKEILNKYHDVIYSEARDFTEYFVQDDYAVYIQFITTKRRHNGKYRVLGDVNVSIYDCKDGKYIIACEDVFKKWEELYITNFIMGNIDPYTIAFNNVGNVVEKHVAQEVEEEEPAVENNSALAIVEEPETEQMDDTVSVEDTSQTDDIEPEPEAVVDTEPIEANTDDTVLKHKRKMYIVRYQTGGLRDLEDTHMEIFTTREMARDYLKHVAQRFRNDLREMNTDEEGLCFETIQYGCNRQDRQIFSYCGEKFDGEVISKSIDDAALFY